VGPYHCILLGGGALDTKGGPVTDAFGRMLDAHDSVFPGCTVQETALRPPRGRRTGERETIGLFFAFGALAGGHKAARLSCKLVYAEDFVFRSVNLGNRRLILTSLASCRIKSE